MADGGIVEQPFAFASDAYAEILGWVDHLSPYGREEGIEIGQEGFPLVKLAADEQLGAAREPAMRRASNRQSSPLRLHCQRLAGAPAGSGAWGEPSRGYNPATNLRPAQLEPAAPKRLAGGEAAGGPGPTRQLPE